MAKTGRYFYCPMAGRMRRKIPNPAAWFRRWKRRRQDLPDLYAIAAYNAPYYPAGYKK